LTSRIISIGLLVLSLGFAGCTQCERACRAEAVAYDSCLREWGQEWRDVGADDRDDYRDICITTWNTYLDGLGEEARSDELAQCADLTVDLNAASDCDESRVALQAYGVVD
jgi:hypothetical protein